MELIDVNDKARLADANKKSFERLVARMEQYAEQKQNVKVNDHDNA